MKKTRYKVIKKIFHDGVLRSPGDVIEAEPGIKNAALVEVSVDRSGGHHPQPVSETVLGVDVIADLRKQVAEKSEQLEAAATALADLQGRLDALRAESDKRISDLEARLSAQQESQKPQQGQQGKAR